MAFRLYITPSEGTGFGNDPRRPKYFDGLRWAGMDYGFQPIFLVAADLTGPQDAAIVANSDVFAFPFDLSPTVGGGNVTSARNALEAALIPAQWVAGTTTWKEVARVVAGMFQFMQKLAEVWASARLTSADAIQSAVEAIGLSEVDEILLASTLVTDTVQAGADLMLFRDDLETDVEIVLVGQDITNAMITLTSLLPIIGPKVLIDSSSKLNVQFGALPADLQQAIMRSIRDLGYALTPQSTDQVRNLLKTLADQWGERPFQLNEFIF